jgi:H+/Cl- antiporter ClcA
MNTLAALTTIVLSSLLLANIAVSVAVMRSHYYSGRQKLSQVLLVWLLPLLGALVVGVFLYSQRDNAMFDTRAYPEPSEKAVALNMHQPLQGREHAP